jgi:predicted membrane-bound spermidine synthase
MSENTPAPLDTSATVESGAGEPVRDLGDLAQRLLAQRAQLSAALVSVVVAVGAVFVLAGVVSGDQVTQWAAVVGGVLAAVGAFLAVLVPILGAKSASEIVAGRAELVRGEVVPVSAVAAYAPAAPDQDIAVGPAVGILDAYDPDQP